MKNIQGTNEDLSLFDENGKKVYCYFKDSKGYSYEYTRDKNFNILTYKDSKGYSYEYTYDEKGNILTYKNSEGYYYEHTRDENGNILTYKDSKDYSYEYTYDEKGKELTYKDSEGFERGVDIPEFTMKDLITKVGNFKLIH